MLKVEHTNTKIQIYYRHTLILRHTPVRPMLEIAHSDFNYASRNGQHTVNERLSNRVALTDFRVEGNAVDFSSRDVHVRLSFEEGPEGFSFEIHLPDGFNFARLNLVAEGDEALYGGGVQFSSLNLRGKRFPIWTSEAGVGRNKRRLSTILANVIAGAGGDFWTTYYPQPSFLSTRGYGCVLEADSYVVMDFRRFEHHVIELLGEGRFVFFFAASLQELVKKQAGLTGIMPPPPKWVFEGGILGIQGGLPFVAQTVDRMIEEGARLVGIWTQDWQGIRQTGQGKRLFWNWEVDKDLYPGLVDEIKRRRDQGIRWLGYINPYLNVDGFLFQIAHAEGFLALDIHTGSDALTIGEFQVGLIDLTNPEAWDWYKGIIKQNLIGTGFSGWMADFGEDVTENLVFFDGRAGKDIHNIYPRLWARLNREAIIETGMQEEALVFHRSGYLGQNPFSNMQWGGDQLVGWDHDDGFPSAITGGLSACMSGIQYYHSDAGGYTTLGWYKRSKELLARWSEANAFSPVLRTHEGNRPWDNAQPWDDSETIRDFVNATRFHAALAPYLIRVSDQAQKTGLPMMRPFCLTNPGKRWRNKWDAWYLGTDLLVFPVLKSGQQVRKVDIPEGEWAHLFKGRTYKSGTYTIPAPIGQPAVFYRRDSEFEQVFKEIGSSTG